MVFREKWIFQKTHIFTWDISWDISWCRDLIKMRADLIPCRLGMKLPVKIDSMGNSKSSISPRNSL